MTRADNSELENPYFDIQIEMGMSKHVGGLETTKELVELCHIDQNKYVLVIGSGNGISACWIAKVYGCRIMGIDLSEGMVTLSNERIRKEGLEDRVEIRVADAQELPFDDDVFDAVLSESVTAFPDDKQKAIREYVRVVKKGGYVGLNETTWIGEPTTEMVDYAIHSIGGCKPETALRWKGMLEESGLQDITVINKKMNKFKQFIGEIRMYGFAQPFVAIYKLFSLYLTRPPYRRAINNMVKDAISMPKKFMSHFGTGIYVGRK